MPLITKILKKWHNALRRLSLGEKFKHQYNCHPNFDLLRGENSCTVLWNKQSLATIPYAHTFSHTLHGPCWIVASGPSLAEIDLLQITKYPSISLNCAIKKFLDAGLTPTHSIIVDHRVFERQWQCVVDSIHSGANCFFSFEGLSVIAERAPELLQQGNIYLIESATRKYGIARASISDSLQQFQQDPDIILSPTLLPYCRALGFSFSLKKGVFAGKTVATWAVQLAFGLGYSAIYIVGMDLGGTGKTHFYADKNNPAPDFLRYYEPHIRGCFELARQASEKTGVKLYNLSQQSALPAHIIPKISFTEALQQIEEHTSSKK
jgi:Kdo-III transferase WaaZ